MSGKNNNSLKLLFSLYLELLFVALTSVINCVCVIVCAEQGLGLMSSAQRYVQNRQ